MSDKKQKSLTHFFKTPSTYEWAQVGFLWSLVIIAKLI